MLDFALHYAAAGLPVVPLHGINKRGTCTCGKSNCSTPGKHPRTKHGLKEATTDEEQIRKWWSEKRWPNASIGGVGGKFICLDIDAKSDGFNSLEELIADNAPLPDTAVVQTGEYGGERGLHYWFRMPEDEMVSSRAGIRPGVDIRCYNGYAVMPPSEHKTGVRYEWLEGEGIETAAEVPEWILDLVPEAIMGDSNWEPNPYFKASKEVRGFVEGTFEVEPGDQRQFLVRAARSVLTQGDSVEEAARKLWEGEDGEGGISNCEQNEENPWTEEEVLYIVEDVFRKGPNSKMEKDFSAEEEEVWQTDVGNALVLLGAYEEDHLFFVPEWGKWYLWNGKSFRENDGSLLRKKWVSVTKDLAAKAQKASTEEERKRLFHHAIKSQSKPRVDACVSLARDYAEIEIAEMNKDPYLLNVENGVVDLRTGELLDPDPKYHMTKTARVEYVEGAESKVWDRFLKTVVPDEELRDFLQKAFGYTLTASVEEHKFFYLHGPPASGKSTLLEAFAALLGNYSESADPSTFMRNPNRNGSGPSEDIARLSNARMVVTHEVEEGMRFAEGHISKLTGGDRVVARFLNAQSFAFYPKFKLWFSANHKPKVSSSSRSGIWRRILVVPMEQEIPEEKRDPSIPAQLRQPEVKSAMLQWALEGAMLWFEDNESHHNMAVPQIVRDEVDAYQEEADHVQGFLKEVVKETGSDKDRVPKRDMFEAYLGWCEREGRKNTMTQAMLSRRISEKGYKWKQAQYNGAVKDCWYRVKLVGIPTPKRKKE